MGVTLTHATVGDLSLPWPAHSQQIDANGNQTVYYAAGGTVRAFRHGPVRYAIARTWEALTEAESAAVFDFWEAIGRAAGDITYNYTPKEGGAAARSVACKIIDDPAEVKHHKNNRDITLTFWQATHPDQNTDA